MGDFFYGWRRKMGLLTLAIALAILCGWMQTISTPSALGRVFWHGDRMANRLTSNKQCIAWDTIRCDIPLFVSQDLIGAWTHPETRTFNIPDLGDEDLDWSFRWCGFGIGERLFKNSDYEIFLKTWRVPYWSIVLPPAVLSAYLLLCRPKPSSKAVAKHSPVTGV